MEDFLGQNGAILDESQVTSSLDDCLSPVDGGVWDRAEAVTQEVIRKIQPTMVSEERRKDVIDYVKGLLKGYLSCEVLPFGSVPLKTYLPDGDIDLTAFCGFNSENAFANDVYSVLEAESRNPAAKFVVKNVQYIHAEVKLVKCYVQNIVVDISFNQIGGLCTLGFLEEIDRLIGKDHLFKRSIILIKAWCYHESRILGSHHGLISSYALETMVLYIFHVFHPSLNGPLAVMYKFLDYFGKFDWENFCVSLSGPVHIASLPEVVAEIPKTSGKKLLLSVDFIRECVRKFSAPSEVAEINYKTFMQKHLNVVDPLNENNNLGRSVSKGNFFRIRSAFSYGAQQLGQILLQPPENIATGVRKFFINTLNRHEKGPRPDVQELRQVSSCNGFIPEISLPLNEPYRDQIFTHEQDSIYSDNQSSDSSFEDTKHVTKYAAESSEEFSTSASPMSEYAIELTTSGIQDLRITEKSDDYEKLQKKLMKMNAKTENGYLSTASNSRSSSVDTDAHSWQNSNSVYQNSRLAGNVFPDLSGDVDCHLLNLQYGRWWFDYGSAMPNQARHQFLPMFQPNVNVSWDVMHQAMPVMNANGVIAQPAFFPAYPPSPNKPRGIGTYFPNPQPYREKASPKKRNPGRLRASRINSRGPTPPVKSPSYAQGPSLEGIDRPVFSDNHARSPREKIYRNTSGFVQAPKPAFCNALESNPSFELENVEPAFGVDDSRLSLKPYRLKDEDFPPL